MRLFFGGCRDQLVVPVVDVGNRFGDLGDGLACFVGDFSESTAGVRFMVIDDTASLEQTWIFAIICSISWVEEVWVR